MDITSKIVSVSTAGGSAVRVSSLLDAVKSAGFDGVDVDSVAPLPSLPIRLRVDGMMCMANCGSKVKRALSAVSGVTGEGVCVAVLCFTVFVSVCVWKKKAVKCWCLCV